MEAIGMLPPQPKKIKKGTIIAMVSAAAALTGGFFVFVYKGKDGITLFQKWTSGGGGEEKIENIAEPVEAPPVGAPKWIAESFPLRKGMFGGQIKILQKKIGAGSDGRFGSGTESKVMAKFGTATVSRAQYDSVVNPAATGGGSNFASVKKELSGIAKNIPGGIRYAVMGKNNSYLVDFYTNNRVMFNDKNGKAIKKGTYSKGGKVITLDDGFTTEEYLNVRFASYSVITHIEK